MATITTTSRVQSVSGGGERCGEGCSISLSPKPRRWSRTLPKRVPIGARESSPQQVLNRATLLPRFVAKLWPRARSARMGANPPQEGITGAERWLVCVCEALFSQKDASSGRHRPSVYLQR